MKLWPTQLLGKISESVMGQAPPGDECNFDGVGTPFVKAGEFGEGRPIIREWTTKPLKFAKSTDVLVCVVGATCGKLNLGADCAIGRSVAAIRPNPLLLNQGFLYAFLQGWTLKLRSGSQGSAQGVITRDMLASIPIPLPPLAEQERIVKLFDNADDLRKLRAQADHRTDDLIPALFHEMFGDPISNSYGWPCSPLGTHLEFLTSGSRGWAKYYAESGATFLRIQNVGNNQLLLDDLTFVVAPENAEANRTKVRSGDVLLSITADLGRTAVIPKDFPQTYINQHLSLLRLRDLDPTFVAATLSSPRGKSKWLELNRSAVKSGLNFNDIRSFPLIVPPLALQKEFAQRVTEIRELEASQATSRTRLDTLFQSMLHRAFNGDL